MTLQRRVRRSIGKNISFYLTGTVLTAITIMLLVGAFAVSNTLYDRFERFFAQNRIEDGEFKTETPLTEADIRALEEAYPQLPAVMIGRGLIADPGMLTGGTEIDTLEAFLNALMDDYTEEFSGCRNALFRMKENWAYLHSRFAGSDKLWKQMRKTTDAAQFRALSAQVLHTCPLI